MSKNAETRDPSRRQGKLAVGRSRRRNHSRNHRRNYSRKSAGTRFLDLDGALAGLGGAAGGVQRVRSEALSQETASLLSTSTPTGSPQVDIICKQALSYFHCRSHCQTLRRPRNLVSLSVSARESSGSGHSCRQCVAEPSCEHAFLRHSARSNHASEETFSAPSRAPASASDPRSVWRNPSIRS
jgi:hypothetical protein